MEVVERTTGLDFRDYLRTKILVSFKTTCLMKAYLGIHATPLIARS